MSAIDSKDLSPDAQAKASKGSGCITAAGLAGMLLYMGYLAGEEKCPHDMLSRACIARIFHSNNTLPNSTVGNR